MNLSRIVLNAIKLLFSISLLFPAIVYAHVISITANTPFPANAATGSTATAFFTVTNIATRASVTAVVKNDFPKESGLSIGASTCGGVLKAGQSCTVTLNLMAPANAQTINSALQVWAKPSADGVQYPFTIQIFARNPNSRFVYVTNFDSNSVSYCQILSDGSLTSCQATGANFNSPFAIAINPAHTMAYVINLEASGLNARRPPNSSVTFCKVNSDGSLSSCAITAQGVVPEPTGIAINSAGTYAYITGTTVVRANHGPGSGSIYSCKIKSDGSLNACERSSPGISASLAGITINPAGTIAYVVSPGGNEAYACSINSNGTIGNCSVTGTSQDSPSGISLNNSGTASYQANNDCSSVTYCSINLANGGFSNCKLIEIGVPFICFANQLMIGRAGIAINANNTIAYVVQNGSDTINYCNINSDGSFSTCADTGTGFSNPTSVAVV